MELFDDGEGLLRLVLGLVERGELGVEGGVVGVLLEGGGQKRLGLIGLLLTHEEMDEGCGGLGVVGVGGEQAAVGGLGGGGIVVGLGELAGEQDVVGGLGRELEGSEQFVAGCGGICGLVEPGEGAIGAGSQGGVAVGDDRRRGEFGVRVGEPAGAGEEETEGQVGLEEVGTGSDGAAVGGLGLGGLVECSPARSRGCRGPGRPWGSSRRAS